ncbi:unnamed protein product [Bursaphelenchus xylophilus]|uniref:(pine wood nematode) hypothetical protein n=1 Tax=Bursaphelenchus xylophilus TaxID=6326 RepID=A0A7I8X1K7_BURXY|nr:unnamed protein product [Bursaphelenchus xylophilus]CAG9130509.1 unnamed protein product [Bursaphelenchus xylophilus]
MSDHKQLFLFGRAFPSKLDENAFIERIIDSANSRNKYGSTPTPAISSIPANEIVQMVVGSSSIGFLFKNNRIARLDFEIVTNSVLSESPESNQFNTGSNPSVDPGSSVPAAVSGSSSSIGSSGSGLGFSSSASANRNAKIRRMMIAARRPGAILNRTGVIVDRSRSMLPASSIPEELIAQAQVVLQGKSREVIVRELQRTNLNVNEAVNNLLSRDDDEDEMDDQNDSYLHEELLSLLDAGLRGDGAAAVIDGEGLYTGAEYEYMLRDPRRRDDPKTKDRKIENQQNAELSQQNFRFSDELFYWHDVNGEDFPNGVTKFIQIGASYSGLYGLGDNGKLYEWSWKDRLPVNEPHEANKVLSGDEKIVNFSASAWRIVYLTNNRRVGSFMDDYCGSSLGDIFSTGPIELPEKVTVEKLMSCSLYAACQTSHKLYWWGVHPFTDRVLMFENAKKKTREEPVLRPKDIVVGSEVRTRAIPIYASGSVGVSFANGAPMIGVLMEAAWTMNETCRFRVMTPQQYASYSKDKHSGDKTNVNHDSMAEVGGGTQGTAQYKETAWSLKDVTFIFEEPVCDTAVVKIVDGSYAGIVYKSAIEQSEKENNGVANEVELLKSHLRLMRKDELVVVPSVKLSRSPQTFQKKLCEVKLPKNIRRIISSAIDNNSFQLLAEKCSGEVALVKTNGYGTDVCSQYIPIDISTLNKGREKNWKAFLDNYGDENILVMCDANGSMVPLIPDSTNGIKDPVYLGLGASRRVGVGVSYLNSGEVNSSIITSHQLSNQALAKNIEISKTVQKMALVAILVAPEARTTEPRIDSLIQNIQYCNLNGVKSILKELESDASDEEKKYQILTAHTNGNRNIFHTAIMNAFATSNKDQADDFKQVRFENGHIVLIENAPNSKKVVEKLDTGEAEAVGQKFDQRWKDMISASSESMKGVLRSKSSEQPMEVAERNADRPVSARQRQKNAIMILAELVSSPVLKPYFEELMKQRDIHGHTPFYSAIHLRAYSAAVILWHKIKDSKIHQVESLAKICLNGVGCDSPLFILCYNDTCSFTWTGEEHINQDIFECKTCDLVGSLCCCTECAYTCHRDHDCKLKRTSPTAYCDCWEKCGCKALVSGNIDQREELLKLLLKDTNLINSLNSKGEHLILFLTRALGRQLVEQENFPRRTKLRSTTQATSDNVPEHDLDPPKFTGAALQLLLNQWESVKSVLKVGLKTRTGETAISEDLFQLNEQDGVNHLDRFIFTLLARSPESHLDSLLNTLVREANKKEEKDPEVNLLISRFTRSVVRLFIFLCIASPMATSTSLNAVSSTLGSVVELRKGRDVEPRLSIATSVPVSSTSSSKSLMPNYRAITVSGVLSLVRTSLPSFAANGNAKESKKKAINAFILKCHRVFQVLVSYSITEIVNIADAVIAPARLGVAKQTVAIHKSIGASDVLDMIERYLNSETDLTALLMGVTSSPKRKRNRRISMHRDNRASDGSDSEDSDGDDSPGSNTNYSAAAVETARRTVDNVMREAMGGQVLDYSANVQDGYSSSNNSDDEDDENDEDDFDGEDEEVAEISGARRDGENAHDETRQEGEHGSMDEDEGEDEEEEEDRMDDDIVDESGDEYSDEDHYDYSSEGEHSVYQDQYEEVVDIDGSNAGEASVVNAQPRRERRKSRRGGRRGRNETANSAESNDQPVNAPPADEPMDAIVEASHEDVVVEPAVESQDISSSGTAQSTVQPGEADSSTNLRFGSQPAAGFRPVYNAGASSRRLTGRQLFTTQSPSVGWAVRRVRQQNDGNESTVSVDNDGNAGTHERVAVADNNNAVESSAASTSRVAVKKAPLAAAHADADIYQTKLQLSACFALLVKVLDDLTLRLLEYDHYKKQNYSGIEALLDLNAGELFNRFKKLINHRLDLTWTWFQKIMDRMEAMLRFGNALLKSPAYADLSFEQSPSRLSKREKRREKKEQMVAAISSKRDFYNYFMSLMRSHSSENGDEMPVIESTPFRHISLIAEAFLYHTNISELFHDKLSDFKEFGPQCAEKVHGLRKFYKRSESISYPSLTTADPHNAFKYPAGECVPLAVRSSLLKPESDKADMFLIPVPERTVEDHLRVAREHGLENPTYQSLAPPPLSHSDVCQDEADDEEMKLVESEKASVDKEKELYEEILSLQINPTRMELQKTLGRWGNAMIYLAKAFKEDIIEYSGQDSFNSILLNEVGGFSLKHSQFKARIDKYRAGIQKDLSFMNMTREKHSLVSDVFHHLNSQYNRRLPSNGQEPSNPILGANRVKATFRDEPGEGSGVVRSFYSALADALIEMDYLPKEGEGNSNSDSGISSSSPGFMQAAGFSSKTSYSGYCILKASGQLEYTAKRRPGGSSTHSSGGLAAAAGLSSTDRGVRTRAQQRAAAQLPPMPAGLSSRRNVADVQKFLFNLDTPPYNPRSSTSDSSASRGSEPPPSASNLIEPPVHSSSAGSLSVGGPSRSQRQSETNSMLLGEKFYEKITGIQSEYSRRIAGLIVNGLPLVEQLTLIANDELLTHLVLTLSDYFLKVDGNTGEQEAGTAQRLESLPLFMKTPGNGLLSPIPGNNSSVRRNAFRNVGRIIGLCLLQLEILPLKLCRHVLKYILDRPITWYDLAFFDPAMFDSLRSIAYNEEENRPHSDEFYEGLGLTFVADVPAEEGGGLVELIPGGENKAVTKDNVLEYIYLFVEKRLLGDHVKALDSIKQGVFDVVPPSVLQGLTSEDLRLILCGSEQISIKLLEGFTTFMDESSSKPESVNKIKRWFYSVISKFSDEEKQDLLFFWTGSPSLPSAEEAFTPLPTVMIRPHDDQHLPTANTCISRLYLPFYSSKKILRAKLLVAIQTRDFGFV